MRSGGPGEEASSLDLLVTSLVSCALNALRHDFVESGQPEGQVEIFARIERKVEGDYLGTLIMECFIDGVDDLTADQLVAEYKKRCRIYNALKDSLPVVFVPQVAPWRAMADGPDPIDGSIPSAVTTSVKDDFAGCLHGRGVRPTDDIVVYTRRVEELSSATRAWFTLTWAGYSSVIPHVRPPYGYSAELIAPDGRWRPATDLRKWFLHRRAIGGHHVGAYCGGGVSSSLLVFAAAVIGQPIGLYVGSWSAWSADPNLPVEQGAALSRSPLLDTDCA
ncbi:hypothetical protein ACQHIV_04305 [Kribbella sp. GL6]|uniref:hypothetical protein n=1 Tax=Kribbella sp. GL6 TaxID=3419765 RepID=UPI003D02C00C